MKKTLKISVILIMNVILSINTVSQWVQTSGTPEGGGITDLAVLINGNILATTSSYNWPATAGGIRLSTNGGESWQNVVNAYNGRTLHLGTTGKIFASY